MKKVYLISLLVFVAFAFGRVSIKHEQKIAPSNVSYGGDKIFLNATQDEDSIKWKRRHKKRKKSRRPQRGR